ncbi:polysaccharide biosynthesis tyrosine autokinase [Sphingobium sp. H39-3-25]|uniref:GumC family protein n=1 Tax=Sphingobium arseniciresistens TaxID=3030834 RepID=UPI0023B93512|nr:polysaccharide biosynthesis tyrosine autokinase [Sphingobium arseniciresistens]
MEVSREAEGYEGRLADLVIMVRDTVRRRWKTMAAITLAIFVAGVALVMMMTPQFEATARVQIDPSRNPLAKSGDATATLTPEAIETEVSVISSLDVAQKVVRKLKLTNDPEFSKAVNEQSGVAMSESERTAAIASALLNKLSVSRDKLTYIIQVKFRSRDPIKASRVANAFAEGYLETKIDSKAGTARSQVDWFRSRLDKLGREVREADAKVAQYRASAGIISGGPGMTTGTIADERVGPLSGQIATAESQAAAAQAQLAAAKTQAARGGLDSVSEVRSSPVVAELRRQRAQLLRDIGEVQARYGEKHPESLRIRGQLETVDAQIKDEGNRVLGSLQADAAAKEAQVSSLRGSMSGLEVERAQNTRAAVLADSLERESTAKRAEYDRLSQMLLESTQAAQNSIAQAEIVGRAEVPTAPASPNKPLLFALSLIVGLAAGGGTIAAQEMMVTGLRSANDVETQLGVPLLAAVPKVGKDVSPADLVVEKPTSLFSESLRIARASILGVRSDRPSQVIAITSALPSEGKTTTALAFARTLAIGNAKTLLLECDVRRAVMRGMTGNDNEGAPGIVEVLHGDATLQQAIRPSSAVANLDQLFVTSPFFSSEDLFGGDKMRELLKGLSTRYDKIVLDLPPLIGLADGRFLAVLADVTVMVVKWDETPTNAVVSAMNWLRSDGANPVGAVFTMADTQAEAIGGLYYSKKYSSYYQNQ